MKVISVLFSEDGFRLLMKADLHKCAYISTEIRPGEELFEAAQRSVNEALGLQDKLSWQFIRSEAISTGKPTRTYSNTIVAAYMPKDYILPDHEGYEWIDVSRLKGLLVLLRGNDSGSKYTYYAEACKVLNIDACTFTGIG